MLSPTASPSSNLQFKITHKSTKSHARCGILKTPSGEIETPNFIFCATKASLKGLSTSDLEKIGVDMILSNTYHLMLQPGADLVSHMGGLHKFMHWKGPMLTDSGGFQVFSLGHGGVANEIKGRGQTQKRIKSRLDIQEEGVFFKSYLNGDTILLTPEKSIAIQQKLGADLIVSFDECTPYHVPRSYTEESMRRSIRWAERCLKTFNNSHNTKQGLLAVIQGGVYPDLRQESADFANANAFFGYAIGGSLGSQKSEMDDVVKTTATMLNPKRYKHLLGIGHTRDIKAYVPYGIDTFDCVHPTRIARHGGALIQPTANQRTHLNLKNACFAQDKRPIAEDCPCPTCERYTRSYLHHLFKAKEILGLTAVTLHNVAFMVRFMKKMRQHIQANKL